MTNPKLAGGDLEEPSVAEQRATAILQAAGDEWDSKPSGASFLEKDFGRFRAVIDKRPELLRDKQGRVVGVDAWVRLFDDDKGREIPIDPHRRIINPPTVPRSGIVEEDTGQRDELGNAIKRRLFTANPLRAFYEAVRDSVELTPNAKGWRTRGTVTTIFDDASDDRLQSLSTTYANARAGTGTTTVVSTYLGVGQVFNTPNYFAIQGFVSFDTSSIADGDIVSAVDLAVFRNNSASNTAAFTVEAYDRNWGVSVTTADFVAGASLGGLTLVASIGSGSTSVGSYATLTSQAAFLTVTNIKTGTVFILLASDVQRLGTVPTAFPQLSFDLNETSGGTTTDPKLTITHASPGSSPMFTSRPNRIWRLG